LHGRISASICTISLVWKAKAQEDRPISQPIFLVKLPREAFRFPIKTHLNRRRQECLLFPGYSGAANRSAWNGKDLARIKQHQNKQTISQTIASRQFEAAAANCGRREGGISERGGIILAEECSVLGSCAATEIHRMDLLWFGCKALIDMYQTRVLRPVSHFNGDGLRLMVAFATPWHQQSVFFIWPVCENHLIQLCRLTDLR